MSEVGHNGGGGPERRRGSRARLRFAADDRLVALVRRGDPTAFEVIYDRHVAGLLSFCHYMLGSRADAEDAVQAVFASAHRAVLADERDIEWRPWLFAIARNQCLSMLRARRVEVDGVPEAPAREDPAAVVERREDLRQLFATVLELPESQRAALVLSELHGFSQAEIGELLGVRTEQVKSFVFQARSNLVSERDARSADCATIREELTAARGAGLLKSRLRRHVRSCSDCRAYAAALARQRQQLGLLLPIAPSYALKRRVMDVLPDASAPAVTCGGGALAGVSSSALEIVGGGAKTVLAKLLVGAACVGAGTGAAAVVLGVPIVPPSAGARDTPQTHDLALASAVSSNPAAGQGATAADVHASTTAAPTRAPGGAAGTVTGVGGEKRADPVSAVSPAPGGKGEEPHGKSEEVHGRGEEPHGKSEDVHAKGEEPHGKSEEVHGKSEEPHGKSEEAPHGKSEETHGKGEETHGKSEEAHGKGEEPHGRSEEPHGRSEEPHGKSEEAPGKSEEPHGKSEEPHGKGEEVHGKSEESPRRQSQLASR